MSLVVVEKTLIDKTREVLQNRVREVDSLPADWDADTLKRILLALPGVYWIMGGGRGTPGRADGMVPIEWACVIATNHASGPRTRLRGDAVQVGASDLIDVLIPSFNHFTVPDEGTLALTAIENLNTPELERQGVALYALLFQMPMAWPAVADLNSLAPFQTFDAKYDIPTHETDAERRKWLNNDYTTSRPDAEDQVAVPQ